MKPTTEKGFRDKIRRACQGVGTYKEEFETLIWRLAETYVRMQDCKREFQRSGGQIIIKHTNKSGAANPIKNPLLVELDNLQKNALEIEKELGLTPSALKRINEAAMAPAEEQDPLTAALNRLRVV